MDKLENEVVRQALERAAWDKRRASMEYRTAVEQAHSQGWKHTEIARVVGVSEAAVRLYLKRSGASKKTSKKRR
jgi:DNA-directed RNA polymerase specialized sigma24 family protein